MHDGGNGLSAKEYARLRATVCASEWTGGDLAAWFAMCALYVITHFPVAVLRMSMPAGVVAAVYPLYLFVIAYMSRDLFVGYISWNNRIVRKELLSVSILLLCTFYIIAEGKFYTVLFFFSLPVFSGLIDSFHDAQKEARWQAHIAAHANPACHFHADCLCACDACAAPTNGPRHAGCEKHGVDVSAYLAGANVDAPNPWVACYIGAATVVPLLFASLAPHLLYLFHPSGPQVWFWFHLVLAVSSQMFASTLILADSRPRAEFMRYTLVYMAFVLGAFVWNTAMVGVAYWIAAEAPETRWLSPVVHVLGFVVLGIFALAGFFLDQKEREAAYIRAHARPECTMHPQCLCTCDRCGAPAPAERRGTRRAADSKK